MKKLILVLFCASFLFSLSAQTPLSFNYQAVVRDAGGSVIVNTTVNVNVKIHEGTPAGNVVLDEVYTPLTNGFGLINLQIGSVQPSQFANINWGGNTFYIETIINGVSTGTQQLLSVPYALHSKTSEDAFSGNYSDLSGVPSDVSAFNNDAGYLTSEIDGDVTNELQVLSISNDTIYLSNGGFIKLPAGFSGNYNDLTGAPSNVSAFTNDAGYLTSYTETDGDVTNELQTLSIAGNDLSISDGNTVQLPQTVYTAGAGISVSGNTISNTQPDQTVTITGGGATTVTGTYPSFTISSTDNVNDADSDPANELQTLSLAANTLSLTNGGSVSMSGYVDTLWKSNGTKIYNSNSGNVGVGINNPTGKMVVQGDALLTDADPLFEVKDRTGATVFVVYPDSVRIFVGDDGSKTNKGTFAVSGRNTAKAFTHNYLLIRPDSSRVYTGNDTKGFGVQNIGSSSTTSYMQLTPSNYFIGHEAGRSIKTGLYNSFLGYQAGRSDTSGSSNVFIGYQSGYSNSSGVSNTGMGYQSLYSNTTGMHSVAIGHQSGYANTGGGYITAVGYRSLYENTLGNQNTAVGYMASYHTLNGGFNTSVGSFAMTSNTSGGSNTAVGCDAMEYGTTAVCNTSVGREALYFNSLGSYNTAVGRDAGFGSFGVDQSQCTFIGSNSYVTTARSNITMLGYGIVNAQCTGDNQVMLGNTAITQIRAQVTGITAYSDKRFKSNVQENVAGLDFIMKLKPVTYNENPELLHRIWGTPDSVSAKIDHKEISKERFIGFLAQDVEKAAKESGFDFPGIDVPRNENEVYSLRYTDFIMPLVKSVQELSNENEELKKTIILLEDRIVKLETK